MSRFPLLFVLLLLALGCVALPGQAQARESVLLIGDSLSISLGQQLERHYALRPGVEFHRQGKVSSGLARPDFYDWEAQLTSLARRQRPNLLVIMLGTNDDKPLRTATGVLSFGSRDWDREYRRRVQSLVDIARRHNPAVEIHWIGAPVMGKDKLDQAVRHINGVVAAQLARNTNCQFIDTRSSLTNQSGAYTQYTRTSSGQVQLRADDGVHLTPTGAALLAQTYLDARGSGSGMLAAAPKPEAQPAQLRLHSAVALREHSSGPSLQAPVAPRNAASAQARTGNSAPAQTVVEVKTAPASLPVERPAVVASAPEVTTPLQTAALRTPTQPAALPAAVSQSVASAPAVSKPAVKSAQAAQPKLQPVQVAGRPYALQESSWSDAAQAKRRADKLAAKGLSTWVKQVDLGAKGIWHRVMIGSFENLDRAQQHKRQLAQRFSLSHALIVRVG